MTIAPPYGWLRSSRFDMTLIFGIVALAFTPACAALFFPQHFELVFLLNLWLLGYHHVVSTMTRLVFDLESFEKYQHLVTWVPLAIFAATAAVYRLFGSGAIITVYFYWQWFHYTRQSYGIAHAYRRKARAEWLENPKLTNGVLYLIPLWGILYRSFDNTQPFLWGELWHIRIPAIALHFLGLAAVMCFGWWAKIQFSAWMRGRLQVAYTAYVLSHVLIFTMGYVMVPDINEGWLILNIWHNAQYILFVWMYNNRRFKDQVDPAHRFLSTISQGTYFIRYMLLCAGFSSLIYFGINQFALKVAGPEWLPHIVVVYSAINFHHYVVDGIVWKLRTPAVRKNLGLAV